MRQKRSRKASRRVGDESEARWAERRAGTRKSSRDGVHRADAVVWEPVSHLHQHRQPLRGKPVARAEQRLFHAVLSAAKGRRDAEAVDLRGDGGSADTSAGDGEERLRARRRVVRAVRTEGRLIGG